MVVQFTSYPADPHICVVTTLKMYLACLRCKRGDYKQLFISYLKLSSHCLEVLLAGGIRLLCAALG